MDIKTNLAFHASGRWIHFPYTNSDLAVRFLDKAKVDYVVLRRAGKSWGYYREWFEHGIPDTRAQLVYVSPNPQPGAFLVFRWHRAPEE